MYSKYITLGLLLAANLNDLIEELKDIGIKIFMDTSSKFIEKLEASPNHQQYIGLVKLQIAEISSLLRIDDIRIDICTKPSNPAQEPRACTSNTLKTPKSSVSKTDLSKIKKFSPLVIDGYKIRCSVSWCKSRFSHKRSYNKHMAQFHPNVEIDQSVKDPPGKCELLTAGLPCHTTLCERAMRYHLQHIHGIHVPAEHFLYGFDTSSEIPSAIFVPYTHRYQAKKSSTMNVSNVVVVSQNIKKGQKRSYPIVSQSEDIEYIDEESIDVTPKPPKRKRVRRSLYVKSSSESSHERSFQPLQYSSPLLSTEKEVSRYENDDVNNDVIFSTPKTVTKHGNSDLLSQSESMLIETAFNEDFPEPMGESTIIDHPECSNVNLTQGVSSSPEKNKSASKSSHSDDNSGSSSRDSDESSDTDDSDTNTSSSNINDFSNNSSQDQDADKYIDQETEICIDQAMSDDNIDDISHNSQEEELNDDSDIEYGDTDLYTTIRRRNREIRYKKRNINVIPLCDREENRLFIEDFKYFLLNFSVSKQTTSTVTKACSHLFVQDDSLLSFEFEKNPEFCLENLRRFTSNSFIHVRYPGDWLNETAADNGNRGLDRLKCHTDLREFLEYEADRFSASTEFSATKQAIRDNLNGIKQQITNSKLYRKYNILSNTKHQKRKNAKMILQSSATVDLEHIIKTWNSSLEKDELDRDYEFMFTNCMENNSISIKMLTQYSQYARIVLLMTDKNRGGVYQFTCRDFVNRHPCYFPDDYEGFNALPQDWKPLMKPAHNPTPSTWMICLPGI